MAPIVYLVSGANRGIGFGLVTELAARENTVIFAGTRRTERDEGTKILYELADACPNKIFVVQLTSGDEESNAAAVKVVKEKTGRLDVVIANAGIGRGDKSVVDESTDELRAHWDVNCGGPHVLFKATYSLLCRDSPRDGSSAPPKFVVISTTGASIEIGPSFNFNYVAYGASKAAMHYVVRKIHFEHEKDGLVAFPICPGPVATDMWNVAVKSGVSITSAYSPRPVGEASKSILKVVDAATRDGCGGKFASEDGQIRPW